MTEPNYHKLAYYSCRLFETFTILFLDPENLRFGIAFPSLFHYLASESIDNRFSVMATSFAYYANSPRVPGGTTQDRDRHPPKDITTAKKVWWYAKTRFTQKSAFHHWTILTANFKEQVKQRTFSHCVQNCRCTN